MPDQNQPRQAEPYTVFAHVYDDVMADIEYEQWAEFILTEAARRGFAGGRVLDLGCGTGNSAAPLLRRGYEVIGVDASEAMLARARERWPEGSWHQGDFTDFRLDGRFSLVQSVFDALNNLLSREAFLSMARRVHAHLEPGGLFMFDINTVAGLRELWEAGFVQGWLGDDWYGWTHKWDEESRIATVEAGFLIDGTEWIEVHRERAYEPDELRSLLQQAGFSGTELIDYPDGEPAPAGAPRLWVVTRRP